MRQLVIDGQPVARFTTVETMCLSPNAVRSRSTAVSTACVSVPLPGSAAEQVKRDTTAPGWCANARIVAIAGRRQRP